MARRLTFSAISFAVLLFGGCDRGPAAPPPATGPSSPAVPAAAGAAGRPHARDLQQMVDDWSVVRDYLGPDPIAMLSINDALQNLSRKAGGYTRFATKLRPKAQLYFEQQPAVPLSDVLDPGPGATMAQLFDPNRPAGVVAGLKDKAVDPAISRLIWDPEPARTKWANIAAALSMGTGRMPSLSTLRLDCDRLTAEQARLRVVTDDAYLITARGGGASDIEWTTRFAPSAKTLGDFRAVITAARAEIDAATAAFATIDEDLTAIANAFDDRDFALTSRDSLSPHVNLDPRRFGLSSAEFLARIRDDLALRQRHAYAMAQKPYHLALPRKTTETWPLIAAVRVAGKFDAWYDWATSAARHPSGNRLDPVAFPINSPKTKALFDEYRDIIFWQRPIIYSDAIDKRNLQNKPLPMVNEAFVEEAMSSIEKRFAANLSPDALGATGGAPSIKAGAYSSWDWYARLNNEVFNRYGDSDLLRDYAVHLQQYFSTPQEAVWLSTPDAPFLP